MRSYSQEEAQTLFARVTRGEMSEAELSRLLLDLKERGETPSEIAGAAAAFLDSAAPFPYRDDVADCVGTGGDGVGTLNVSTAVMFVAAEMGLKMAKHGNVAVSSKCGSADVLVRAGIKVDMSPEVAAKCLDALNVTFLYAPKYHLGMRHAMPVRKALGVRTIFNVLGPLLNPARPRVQLVGVYAQTLVRPYAETLLRLGLEKGLVVHGSGIDEIALHGSTTACLIREGKLLDLEINPAEVGLGTYSLENVLGADSETNYRELTQLLSGRGSSAYNALVAINAAYLYWISGRSSSPKEAAKLALSVIEGGKTIERLYRFVEMSHA